MSKIMDNLKKLGEVRTSKEAMAVQKSYENTQLAASLNQKMDRAFGTQQFSVILLGCVVVLVAGIVLFMWKTSVGVQNLQAEAMTRLVGKINQQETTIKSLESKVVELMGQQLKESAGLKKDVSVWQQRAARAEKDISTLSFEIQGLQLEIQDLRSANKSLSSKYYDLSSQVRQLKPVVAGQ